MSGTEIRSHIRPSRSTSRRPTSTACSTGWPDALDRRDPGVRDVVRRPAGPGPRARRPLAQLLARRRGGSTPTRSSRRRSTARTSTSSTPGRAARTGSRSSSPARPGRPRVPRHHRALDRGRLRPRHPVDPGLRVLGPTTESGWDNVRIAWAWVELMNRLGYERYGAMGNDAGSMISPEVGRLDPEHCVGVHVTQLFSFPTGDPARWRASPRTSRPPGRPPWFLGEHRCLQRAPVPGAADPCFGLADSPVALLAWNSQLMLDQDDDFLIGNVATYWFTGTAGSSIRLYQENHLAQPAGRSRLLRRHPRRGATTSARSGGSRSGPLRHPDVAAA